MNETRTGNPFAKWKLELYQHDRVAPLPKDAPMAVSVRQASVWLKALHSLSMSPRPGPGAARDARDLNLRLTALIRQLASAKLKGADLCIGDPGVELLVDRMIERECHERD